MRRLILIAWVAVFAACTQTPSTENTTSPEKVDRPKSATVDTPVPTPEPSAPATKSTSAGDELANWDGYGDTKFGMDEAAFHKAWGGELKNLNEDKACFHLTPKWVNSPAELAFMFVDDKFARYSTESAKMIAPGGGNVGATTAEIEKLYPGRIDAQPHKYTDGKYLRIVQGEDVLIFATDKAGVVTDWRVGRAPAIDYVEGCA